MTRKRTRDDSEGSSMRMTRRDFGKGTVGAVGAVAVPMSVAPFASDSFTALAEEFLAANRFAGLFSFEHTVTKYGGKPSWPVSVSDGEFETLRDWANESEHRTIVREHEPTGTATVSAPVADVAGRYFNDGLADASYVDWVDLDLRVSNVEPPGLPGDEDAHPEFNTVQRVLMSSDPASTTGLAFDAEDGTLRDALETINDVDVTEAGAGYTLGVIDTGLNTDDGQVFGSGPRGSPIRVPSAHNAITGEDADVQFSRVQSLHETREEFDSAATMVGVTASGFDTDGYVEFTPADSRTVTTQSEFQNGTLTDVVATSADELELDTDGSGNYLASGTYLSEWFDFQRDTTFLANSINETLNAETTTWEYRSSPDGTAGNASAWNTDITAVPDDQYLQVRVTLESSDGTATPVVHDYTADVELLSGEFVGLTHTMEGVDQAVATLDLTDATAKVTVEAYDTFSGSWTELNSATVTSSGDAVVDTDPDLEHDDWRVSVVFTKSADGFVAELSSEGAETPEGVDNGLSDWSPVSDGNGHGTWVAAAAAASTTDTAYHGVAPKADLLPIKALDDEGSGSTSTIAAAVRYGVDNGADVLCMSLGSPVYSQDLADALAYAHEEGVLTVVAAGNDRMVTRFVNYPGADEHTLAVSATTTGTPSEVKSAHFANVGPSPGTTDLSEGKTTDAEVGIAAPGMALEASLPTGTSTLSGTSMAAPFVAGAAVTVLEGNPSLKGDADALRARLEETAAPAKQLAAAEATHGLLDVEAAVAGTKQSNTMSNAARSRDAGYRAESAARGGLAARYLF